MPNINDFLKKEKEKVNQVHSTLEKVDGIRPCAKCEEDVDGGLWDPNSLTMTWTCANGHPNYFKVN